MNEYIVVCVDYGDSADGHSEFLGKFPTYEDAKTFVFEDMKDTLHTGGGAIIKEDKMEVWEDETETNGCVWDIFKV